MEKIIVDPIYLNILLVAVAFAMSVVGLHIIVVVCDALKDFFKKVDKD